MNTEKWKSLHVEFLIEEFHETSITDHLHPPCRRIQRMILPVSISKLCSMKLLWQCCLYTIPSQREHLLSTSLSICLLRRTWKQAFHEVPDPNVFSWNVIIGICGRYHQVLCAQQLFEQMLLEGIVPSNVTFISILQAYTSRVSLIRGRRMHSRMYGSTLESDIVVKNALLCMYNKCGGPENGCMIFDTMTEHNVISWTSLIASFIRKGDLQESFHAYNSMQNAGVIPNSFTFVTLLSACSSRVAFTEGKLLHSDIVFFHLNVDTIVGNTLIRMYSMCGCLEDACKVFECLDDPDVVSWTSIIAAYALHASLPKVMQSYKEMHNRGVLPDNVTFLSILEAISNHKGQAEGRQVHVSVLSNRYEQDISVESAIFNMYGKCGQTEYAWNAFDKILDHTNVTWNTAISTHVRLKQTCKAFRIFYQMQQEGFIPDQATYVGMLEACASELCLKQGKRLHVRVNFSGLEADVVLETALIHMYGKNGDIDKAWSVFITATREDTATWNAMIVVLSQHGRSMEALLLFHEMDKKGVGPDEITFMGIILACSHSGLVEEGWRFLSLMIHGYNIEPDIEHFNCMVDLLGRAGCLEDGKMLVGGMLCQPNGTTWTALLSASKTHMNLEQGENAARHAYHLEPEETATYILLSDIYVIS